MNLLNAIFSTSFGFSVLRVTTPIIFAAMAALITNKAGVMNIALEAIMLFGAFFGTVVSAWTQNAFFGVLAAIGAGIILSMLMAFFAFRMKADLILTGIALNTFASGSTVFLMYMVCNDKASTSGLPSCNVPSIDLPLIKSIPVIGEMISGHNLLTYLAFFSVIVVWILIYKTPLGLRIRAVGENAHAAESVGIKVMNVQFIALFLSGNICRPWRSIHVYGIFILLFKRHDCRKRIYCIGSSEYGWSSTAWNADCIYYIWYCRCTVKYASDIKCSSRTGSDAAVLIDNYWTGDLCGSR